MADEYIKRDKLNEEMEKVFDDCEYYGEWEDCIGSFCRDVFNVLEKLPAEEVEKIRYAQPVTTCNDVISERLVTVCSACGGRISKKDNFCKHCGAKMGKKEGK